MDEYLWHRIYKHCYDNVMMELEKKYINCLPMLDLIVDLYRINNEYYVSDKYYLFQRYRVFIRGEKNIDNLILLSGCTNSIEDIALYKCKPDFIKMQDDFSLSGIKLDKLDRFIKFMR